MGEKSEDYKLTTLDRYILGRILVQFLFFTLILAGIYWINTIVRIFEHVLPDLQTLGDLLGYFSLYFPRSVSSVMPISAFAAGTYLTYRLLADNELTILQTSGLSPRRIMKPFAVFGIMLFITSSLFTHQINPSSRLKATEFRQNIPDGLSNMRIQIGKFIFPNNRIATFVSGMTETNELSGVFIHDTSESNKATTYFAEHAHFVRAGPVPMLVLEGGQAQELDIATKRLSRVNFDRLTINMSDGLPNDTEWLPGLREVSTPFLLGVSQSSKSILEVRSGNILKEIHLRVAEALFTGIASLVGVACVVSIGMLGGHRSIAVIVAVVMAVILYITGEFARSIEQPVLTSWLHLYASSALAVLILLCLSFGVRTKSKSHSIVGNQGRPQ